MQRPDCTLGNGETRFPSNAEEQDRNVAYPEQPASFAIRLVPGISPLVQPDLPSLEPQLTERLRRAPEGALRYLLRADINAHIIAHRSTTRPRVSLVKLPKLLVSLIWVTLAVWQVASWQEVEDAARADMLVLGWVALLAAYGYRQWSICEAMRLSGPLSFETAVKAQQEEMYDSRQQGQVTFVPHFCTGNYLRTGCEFSVTKKRRTWLKVQASSGRSERRSEKCMKRHAREWNGNGRGYSVFCLGAH